MHKSCERSACAYRDDDRDDSVTLSTSVPIDAQLDATAPGYSYGTVDRRLIRESEEAMKARGVRSPDEWDAVVLTFAEPEMGRRAAAHQDGGGEMDGHMTQCPQHRFG
jgi:hypothetical protein